MKVVFIENLPWIANAWDIKEVKPWYLRNYLIPNRFAVPATEKIIKETETLRQEQEKIRKERIQASIEQKDNINWTVIEFTSKTDWVNLYAAIGEKDIINKLNEQFKINLDKKAISNVKLKTTWEHPVEVSLWDWVVVRITVKISWEDWIIAKKTSKKSKKSEEEEIDEVLNDSTADPVEKWNNENKDGEIDN